MPAARQSPIHVGVAGWDYRDWKGTVYPERKPRGFDPVRYLACYLDLIEINSTFYRPARAEVAERWAQRVEGVDDFRYTAKLWRRFTHERDEAWTLADVRKVRDGFDPLHEAGKLGAVLIQFPWSFKNEESSREWLSDLVRAFRKYPLVVEVRHESWNEPEFYRWLAEHGVGFVNIDQPLFSKSIEPSARSTARTGYIRVHGRNYRDWWRKEAGHARYDYLYEPAELRPWASRARQIARDRTTQVVDVVFNNHAKGKSVVNALEFKKILARRKVPAPPTLFETYSEALKGYARPVPPEELTTAAERRRAA
ncbi:MAG TPA: DUF72 domain-containing protein [Longimicrobiales bacterium]